MLLHKYYDWRLVEQLPLRMLGELLSAARAREEYAEKEKTEKLVAAMWFARVAFDKISGNEPIEYGDFEKEVYGDEPKEKRTADEIMADMMPIINAERG